MFRCRQRIPRFVRRNPGKLCVGEVRQRRGSASPLPPPGSRAGDPSPAERAFRGNSCRVRTLPRRSTGGWRRSENPWARRRSRRNGPRSGRGESTEKPPGQLPASCPAGEFPISPSSGSFLLCRFVKRPRPLFGRFYRKSHPITRGRLRESSAWGGRSHSVAPDMARADLARTRERVSSR